MMFKSIQDVKQPSGYLPIVVRIEICQLPVQLTQNFFVPFNFKITSFCFQFLLKNYFATI